ncbi:hypothetical protein Goarm_012879 [Gossypium armourianum]|uniref:Uncharacterized protein n=1 Tax=Gossypium armourianum TaxID=34283 RepID=A0A7J9J1B8_9ROSI|nr:hypothetical protein [Gossypium armourianum]
MERFFLVDYEPPETSNVDGTRTDFIYISNCISTHEAWKILKTTYEGITRVKRSKFQMLITIFENLRMFETISKFYAMYLIKHPLLTWSTQMQNWSDSYYDHGQRDS